MWASFEEVGKSGVGALFCLTNNRLKFMKKKFLKNFGKVTDTLFSGIF